MCYFCSWWTIRDVILEYKVLMEKIKEYNKKDAKFYGNMFAKMTKSSSNVSECVDKVAHTGMKI
ncbi:putative peptidylprolyl isomerase [Helianthus annuus]|uniref:Peptidylprolyl isomerase n=1 Tax=Helianthus annuus TaxID=4232 RepID=A0A9K3N3T0_HELAN|nr:putative peptidylprolyl isomerase [Helianthus annuus]